MIDLLTREAKLLFIYLMIDLLMREAKFQIKFLTKNLLTKIPLIKIG